jgi:hypothetical protein
MAADHCAKALGHNFSQSIPLSLPIKENGQLQRMGLLILGCKNRFELA